MCVCTVEESSHHNKLFFNFSLSCCVCVFALLHSSMACHKLLGINLKEKKERKKRIKYRAKLLGFAIIKGNLLPKYGSCSTPSSFAKYYNTF